jgi:hypothetical protein
MTNLNFGHTMMASSGSANRPRHAIDAIFDNVILQLERYDFGKAQQLADLLIRDRPMPQQYFDVLRAAALSAILQRGLTQINRGARESALVEFKRAREMWNRQPGVVGRSDTGTRREPRLEGELPEAFRMVGVAARVATT